ncbi:MAG: GTPase RsgA, partial [Clostridia bacterium]|nr:GTPase RsgA [Clostridia bacterium]
MAFLKSVQSITGRIIKATAGFYYVLQNNGLIWECALRGKFRLGNQGALVGDLVSLSPRQGHTGVIEQIFPRKNELLRPPVANIEQALIIFAIRQPELSRLLLDRFLLQAEIAGVEPIICLNKIV